MDETTESEKALADRRWFELSPEAFGEFERALDEPVRDLPKLRAILGETP